VEANAPSNRSGSMQDAVSAQSIEALNNYLRMRITSRALRPNLEQGQVVSNICHVASRLIDS
jgi:hypothetical protein